MARFLLHTFRGWMGKGRILREVWVMARKLNQEGGFLVQEKPLLQIEYFPYFHPHNVPLDNIASYIYDI